MFEEQKETTPMRESAPRWMGLAIAGLAAVSVLGLGIGWNATNHARAAEDALTAQTKTMQADLQSLSQQLDMDQQANRQLQAELSDVTSKLNLADGQINTQRRQVKDVRTDYTKQISDVKSSVESELAGKANADDVKTLGTDVNGVRTDLESTKGNLQSLRTEHGELIARNHEELEQLRRTSERDYFEFTLSKKGDKQHVGDLLVELRDTNMKKHQFTLALYVDDMRLEKKNKSINEPIYFFEGGSRTPLELVVNQVGKNAISGYLSAPKAAPVATSAKTSSGM